ncbi:hypothetical protein [Shinella zoogloeoides]
MRHDNDLAANLTGSVCRLEQADQVDECHCRRDFTGMKGTLQIDFRPGAGGAETMNDDLLSRHVKPFSGHATSRQAC